jgi:hypothetical protein
MKQRVTVKVMPVVGTRGNIPPLGAGPGRTKQKKGGISWKKVGKKARQKKKKKF